MIDCWTNLLKVRRSERRAPPNTLLATSSPASRRQRQSNTQRAAFNITAETSTGTAWEDETQRERLGFSLFHAMRQEVPSQPLNCHPLISILKRLLLEGWTSVSSSLHPHPLETKEALSLLMHDDCRMQNKAGNNKKSNNNHIKK